MPLSAAPLRVGWRAKKWQYFHAGEAELLEQAENRSVLAPRTVPAVVQWARVITKPKTRDDVFCRKQHQWKGHWELGLKYFPKSKQNTNWESSDTKTVSDLVVVDLGCQIRSKSAAILGWIASLGRQAHKHSLLEVVWTGLHEMKAGETLLGVGSPELNFSCCIEQIWVPRS